MITKRFYSAKGLTLVLLMLYSSALYSQDCKKLINDYITKISSFNQPPGPKVYYMHIGISTTLWDNSGTKIPDVDARLYLTQNAYFYESGPLSLYNDPNDLICLNHSRKQIIISQSGRAATDQAYSMEQLAKMQQELILNGNITSCRDTVINSVKTKTIFLATSPEIRSKLKVSHVEYQYLPETEMIKKVTIFYEFGHSVKWQTIEYKKLDFDYMQWKASKARSLVFDNSGKIRPEYRHYSLIDNRK